MPPFKVHVIFRKLSVLLSFFWVFMTVTICGDELNDILSKNKNLLFEYDFRNNAAQSDKLQKSWMNPIMLRYTRSYSEQFGDKTIKTGSFTVSIDQPIFRSGGIYYAIKYADALRETNAAQIKLKKRELIANAVKLLFQMRKTKLQIKKMKLLIKNDAIDIRQKQESYDAGLLDSSFLDQALLKKNQDDSSLLEMEMNLAQLEQSFALLSDKDPYRLKLPKLKLISKRYYKKENLELQREKMKAIQESYNAKMTWAKYLPVLSLQARYTDADINPLFARSSSGLKEKYRTYGFTLSMPLDINMFSDVEASKVAALKAQTEVIERQKSIEEEYRLVQKKVEIIEKKIRLAKKNEKLYHNLYRVTKNLAKAGEKTKFDTQMMYNSFEIKKLDRKIYGIDREIELLVLYMKVENAI